MALSSACCRASGPPHPRVVEIPLRPPAFPVDALQLHIPWTAKQSSQKKITMTKHIPQMFHAYTWAESFPAVPNIFE